MHWMINSFMSIDSSLDMMSESFKKADNRFQDTQKKLTEIGYVFEDSLELTKMIDDSMTTDIELERFSILDCLEEIEYIDQEKFLSTVSVLKDSKDPFDEFEVLSNYKHLTEIIKELIDNACKHRVNDSQVVVRLYREKDETCISIKNEIGVDQEEYIRQYMGKVFDFWKD